MLERERERERERDQVRVGTLHYRLSLSVSFNSVLSLDRELLELLNTVIKGLTEIGSETTSPTFPVTVLPSPHSRIWYTTECDTHGHSNSYHKNWLGCVPVSFGASPVLSTLRPRS